MPSNPRKTPFWTEEEGHSFSLCYSINKEDYKNRIRIRRAHFYKFGMLNSSSTSSPQPAVSAEPQGNHNAVLAILSDIKASNQALSDRMTETGTTVIRTFLSQQPLATAPGSSCELPSRATQHLSSTTPLLPGKKC